MNNSIKKLGLGVALTFLLSCPVLAQTKIATVNLGKVFDKYWKTGQAVAALKERAAELDKDHQDRIDKLKKANQDYQKLLEDSNNQAISSEERDKRKKAAEEKFKEISDLKDDLTDFERRASTGLSEQKARLRKNILDEIQLAINSIAQSKGYTLVLSSDAQTFVPDPGGAYNTPNVLFFSKENDLTDTVIAQINAGAPVDTKPDSKPDTKDRIK